MKRFVGGALALLALVLSPAAPAADDTIVSGEPALQIRKLTKAEMKALGIKTTTEASPSSIGCLGLPDADAVRRPRCGTAPPPLCWGAYYAHQGQWWFGSFLGGLRIHGNAWWCSRGWTVTAHGPSGAWPEPWGQCSASWGPENSHTGGGAGASYVDYTLRANMHCSAGGLPWVGWIQRNEVVWVTVRLYGGGGYGVVGSS
jgi:hypothetical protein